MSMPHDQDVLEDPDPILEELKREARRRGHIAFVMSTRERDMYIMWLLGILLGLTLAAGRS